MQPNTDFNINTLYKLAFSTALGSIAWGYNLTIFNALRAFLQENVFLDASELSITLIASLPTIGAALGSLWAGRLVGSIGRVNSLLVNDVVGLIGSILCMVQSLPIIIIGRTLQGVTSGMNCVTVPLYNIEMSDVNYKGRIGAVSMTCLAFGVLVGLAVELIVPTGADAVGSEIWRPLLGFAGIIHVIRIVILKFFMNYETPLFLVMQDKIEEAKAVLRIFYNETLIEGQIQRVLKDKEAVTARGNPTMKDMLTDQYKKAFFVSMFLLSGVQLTGFYPIFMFFNVFAHESAGNDPEIVSVFATLIGLVSFFTVVLATIIIDRSGRRKPIVYGMLCVTITELLFVFFSLTGGLKHPILKYLLVIWPFFYRLTVGTMAFVYVPEALPSIGVSICMFSNWMLGFVAIQTLMPIIHMVGVTGAMTLFAMYSCGSTILYYKYVIETKGRTKAEILEIFRGEAKGSFHNKDVEMSIRAPLLKLGK